MRQRQVHQMNELPLGIDADRQLSKDCMDKMTIKSSVEVDQKLIIKRQTNQHTNIAAELWPPMHFRSQKVTAQFYGT